MMSLYVISLSLIPNIFSLSDKQNQVLLASTVVMSTFIIVLTLTEGYESFYHKAEVLHDSARQLNKLAFKMSQIDFRAVNIAALIAKISEEYEAILERSVVNHAECDYIRVRSRRPELFGLFRPTLPTSKLDRTFWQTKRSVDWIQSVIREFLWLSLPVLFSIFAALMIYLMIAYDWPESLKAHKPG
jgi:hypothetical protein